MRLARIERDMANDAIREKNELIENVSKMTKAELIEYAEYNGIEINKTAKKAEITEDVLEIVKKR